MRLLKKCKTLRAALGGRLARMGRRGRWELSVLLGLALALSLSSFTRFSAACAGVREDTLRLHILANSDSEADQELKLAVRDAILQAEGGMFAAERTKEGALRAAGADLEAIRAVAQRTVRARGYSYPVAVRLENMYFSTREYDGFTLPAGRYDAVRVEIGAHAGKNWFCVLFPPMCVPAATSDGGQDMSAYSGAEQQAVCSSYKVGFAAVEWLEGLKESLSGQGVRTLAEADGPFAHLQVMIHLDHIQHDLDKELLEGDLGDYASILFDASGLPLEENIRKTAAFVRARGREIMVEGACDEIVDATGNAHNALTTPENARRFKEMTGADLVVCNLGTEHRATGKDLQYHGEVSRAICREIGPCIVLHGTSSVPNEQVRRLYADGVCKVNIWTALERDASPGLFADMVRHAGRVADEETLRRLIAEGLLTEKADDGGAVNIGYFTTLYRQTLVFEHMKNAVREYLDMWYGEPSPAAHSA